MEAPISPLIRLVILDMHLHLRNLYLAALFSTQQFYSTIVLDSRSEARYVFRQGRGWGI